MGLLLFLYFLARAALSGLPGTAAGSHNLHYNVTVLSCDGSVQSSFFAGGYLDGQAFLHYDLEKHRAEPWGLWAKELGPEMWDTESKDLTETWKDLRKLLAEILALQEEKGGLHSLQEIMGCEIREDNRARGFRRLSYDGALLLSCHLETPGCAVPQSLPRTLAMEVEKSWDTDDQSKYYQGHVQGELCGRLRGYLESWTGFMERTGPPVVNVTRSQGSEGTVNLTCWALGFFPPNISVAWFWDEEPMSLDAQQSGDVLPDGNGTYRTWVTIRVPQGEEQRVKCHVEHSGNHSAHPAPAGKTLVHQSQWQTIVYVALGIVCVIALSVLWCMSGRRRWHQLWGAQSPRLPDLDRCQMAATDRDVLTQPGLLSLLSDPESVSATGELGICSQEA